MEGIGADLEVMKRVPLAAGHIDAIRAIGRERSYAAGDIMARIGDPMDRFLYVVEGEIEVLDPYSEKRLGDATVGPGQFVGELSFLNGGNYFLAMRAVSRTVTIEVAREAMLDLMARVPELSDHIITVFAARRQQPVERRGSSIKVIGSELDPDIQKVGAFLSRNHIPFQSFDLDGSDEEAMRLCKLVDHEPAVIFDHDRSQAAMYLSRVAQRVHILVRGDKLSDTMSSYLVQRLEAQPKIEIHFGTEVIALHGGDHLERISVRSGVAGDAVRILSTRALFVMIGASPNTGWLSDLVELDNRGFVKTRKAVGAHRPLETSRQGIFAVGDVRAGSVKRVASAAGEGSVVVSGIYEFLGGP